MLKLSVNIESNNESADTSAKARREAARVLREMADKILAGTDRLEGGAVMDVNGNSIGDWECRVGNT